VVARLAVHRMPLRVPQQAAVARLIVLPMPRRRMAEANTVAANTVNQSMLTFVVAPKRRPEAAEHNSSASFCVGPPHPKKPLTVTIEFDSYR
jgi:hypothetical protein